MKYNIKSISSVKKLLHIEIPKEEVKKYLDDAYSDLRKTVNVKGFRLGKTPRSVLKRLYENKVNKNVSSQLIKNGLSEAISESKLNFIGSKNIKKPELKSTEAYCFDAEIDVKPDIGHIDFKGLSLKRTMYEPSNDEVDAQFRMLQKNMAKKESIGEDRSVEVGDFVLVDYEIYKDISSKSEEKIKNVTFKVGSSFISKDLDNELLGMSKNEERDINVELPSDYRNTELAGLKTVFKVKLRDILKEEIPELNDEMAKKLGPFNNVEDLKDKILENLKEGYEKRKEQDLNEQIFTNLIEKTDFELPETMVQYEIEAIIADTEKSFKYHNKTLEDAGLTREILSKKCEKVAKKQVRRQLILGKIIEQEKMKLTDSELEKGFKDISLAYSTPVSTVKAFYDQHSDKLEAFKYALLEKKAIDIIVKGSEVEEIIPSSVKN